MNASRWSRPGRSVVPLLLGLAVLLPACGSGGDDDAGTPAPWDDDLLRARAAGAFTPGSQRDLEAAWEAIAPLVERPDAEAEDLIRAAIIVFADTNDPAGIERARALVDRAAAQDPDDPSLHFVRGNLAARDLDFEQAAEHYRALLAVDPDDAATRMRLGETLEALDRVEEAMEQWAWVRARGLEANAAYYNTATFRLGMLLLRTSDDPDDQARAKAYIAEKQALDQAEISGARPTDVEQAGYGAVRPPTPRVVRTAAPRTAAESGYTASASASVPVGDALRAVAWDVDRDGRVDLVAAGPSGATLALQGADGGFAGSAFEAAGVVALGDLDDSDPVSELHHPSPEVLAVREGRARLFTFDAAGGGYGAPRTLDLGADVRAGTFVDFDHDGDLDLALATDAGLRLLRNDGATAPGERLLADGTPEGLPARATRAVLTEDLDADQDVDLLLLHDDGVTALSNLRGGAFGDVTADWGLGAVRVPGGRADRIALADLDHDLLPDLLVARDDGVVWHRHGADGYEPAVPIALTGEPPQAVRLADLDLDGHLDLVGSGLTGTAMWPGPLVRRDGPLERVALDPAFGLPDVADVDGDRIPDVVLTGDGATRVLAGAGVAPGAALTLRGKKDNGDATGCVVEAWARGAHTRLYARGRPLLLPAPVDVLYVTWPNGVLQREYDLAAGAHVFEQAEGLVGSCPFLYAWNGETFTFVTDVLGTTPLGLPMAPEVPVPFDHEEYVKIRGDQLVPDERGRLRVALTEELREVTYLDRARLHAIDHPAGTGIEPNEGFVFPPFPPHVVHTFTDVVPPARATAHTLGDDGDPSAALDPADGRDVTPWLAEVDGRHAKVWEARPAQFYGLAEPWALDLELARTDAERRALAEAPRVRLVLTGWLRWTDASVNVAAARHPTVAFQPPRLWVPDGDGWRPAGPPIGFPAGKTKSMVVDVTDLLDRDDPRLRLTTTLALSWDAIRVVLDDDAAPHVDTPLEPALADLGFRGISAPLPDPTGELPERFDWDVIARPRWDQHPGRYTRYGDVAELLTAVDDRLVVFGVGDVVHLEFDAAALPPLPEGWTRDWLLYLDGWAKDRDPNTEAATTVDPLPFHGMTRYPPPPGEQPADPDARREWIETWQTREAMRLLVPLAVRHGVAPRSGPGTR